MQLVIEYVFEGHERGYNFTSSTKGIDEHTLKHIWRNAMPRGQGWGQYIGANSLKCFPLPNSQKIAVCDVTVTDLADERGRKGIRKAVVDIVPETAYFDLLRERLANYSESIRSRADDRLTFCKRTNIIGKTLPKFRKDHQLILVRPYKNPDDHQVMEAFTLRLALEPLISMRRWGTVIPFTTFALDYLEESKMVVLPKTTPLPVPTVSLR